MASRARIHLWPEGAVSFETAAARKQAMKDLAAVALNIKVWIGASFDEPDPVTEGHRKELKRNGMVLVGPDGQMFEYFKRNLVPIAESYSHVPSLGDLPLSTIPYPRSPTTPKPEWSTYPRSLPVTASICLDFSQPLPKLPGHPALVLAPARTWHPSIGLAMANLASARAEEVGASVLWCDGGSGAVNGVYGAGRGLSLNVEQVGNGGSWLATFGVPYTRGEEPQRTMYAVLGDYGALLALLAVVSGGWAIERSAGGRSLPFTGERDDGGVQWGRWVGAAAGTIGGAPWRAIQYVRAKRVEGTGERARLLPTPVGNLIDA